MKKLDAKKIFDASKEDGCEFLFGAHTYSQIPQTTQPEIAFIGASNVGKSSLINAITGRKVAIVSNTPGRTRQLNFFKITKGFTQSFSEGFVLVDMPGYGFAKAKDKHIEHWQKTALEYLAKRPNLKRLFLLIDPIKGLKESDRDMINMLNAVAVSFQIILTKADKLSREELEKASEIIKKEIMKWPAAYPQIISTSSSRGYGIREVQDSVVEVLSNLKT
jgi:GTP-binding protein